MRQSTEPDVPLFRALARRWRPVVRIERANTPLRFALPTDEVAPAARSSFGPKKKPAPVKPVRSASSWNPWLWVK